ncbi:MAG: DUF1326 domain-containing protein [Terriglobales bacterium]
MRKLFFPILVLSLFLSGAAFAQQISGDYIESRNADVYTGPCFANGEAGLAGDQAILGWHVRQGSWNGVALEGLSVVAVVKARATLGDPYGKPYPAKAVLMVDEQATPQQREALADFARHVGGELLANIVRVESQTIELAVPSHGNGLLRAGRFVTVQTRALSEHDHFCGNEVTYYPPLTRTTHAMPAVALTDRYRGTDLGTTWETHDKRSAFVGSFAFGVPAGA